MFSRPSCRVPDRLRRLARDRRGVTLLEFAIVVIPLMALLLAIVQTSLVFFGQQLLETVAEKSSRTLMTGTAQQANITAAQFRTRVCANLLPPLECSKVMIDVRSASDFASIVTAPRAITVDAAGNPTNTWSFSPGSAGSIVIVRIMYLWPVQAGPLGFDLSNTTSNRRVLYATSVFKVEPYRT